MSIKQLSRGKYQLNVSYNENGKRIRKSKIVSCNGKKEAQRLEREFLVDLKREKHTASYTVDKMLENYVSTSELSGIKATTIRSYKGIRKRIKPYMGDMLAKDVVPSDVQRMVLKMNEELSAKTVRNTISLLSSAYDNSINLEELYDNPCRKVKMPKSKKKEVDTLSQDDAPRFLELLYNMSLDFQCAILLALLCGLRRSEILGLKKENVNINFKSVSIHETRHLINKETIVQTPKSKRSERTVALPAILAEKLETLLVLHDSYEFECSEYLILNEFGEPLSPNALSHQLRRFEERNDLPLISIHKLRHTFTSWLINSNKVDIAQISNELGHSNISTTLNIYTHVVGGASTSSRAIASATDGILQKLDNSVKSAVKSGE